MPIDKQKYYRVEWPDSQQFIGHPDCIQSDDMSYFVPCELYDKSSL